MDQVNLALLTILAAVTALVLVPLWLRSRERREVQRILQIAVEQEKPLPAEVLETLRQLMHRPPTVRTDLRVGAVGVAAGLAMAALGIALSYRNTDVLYPLLGVAAFPLFIGVAFLILGLLGRGKS